MSVDRALAVSGLLACSYCGYSIQPRTHYLTLDYCPRCLAKRRVAEPLRLVEVTAGGDVANGNFDNAPEG